MRIIFCICFKTYFKLHYNFTKSVLIPEFLIKYIKLNQKLLHCYVIGECKNLIQVNIYNGYNWNEFYITHLENKTEKNIA